MCFHAFLVVLLAYIFSHNGVEGSKWNISAEEDLMFEKKLKMLNKPAIKTILTDYGDIYDCIDFYKQPAFDHPLLKDYKVDFDPLKASTLLKKEFDQVSHNESQYVQIGLKNGGCPIGTVPIRRITKEDLVRERLAANITPLVDDDKYGSHYAIVRSIPSSVRYVGAGGAASIYEPEAKGQEYSAGRMKIKNGFDSLEVGWRVDPTLYGDTKSRLYIRIDAGKTHCFDTRCPGFIVVDKSIPLGTPLQTSRRGGSIKSLQFFLKRDMSNGNWLVLIGDDSRRIGFWPKQLFTGLSDLAISAEWGGEVFSPPGSPKPSMGAGFIPKKPNTNYDAHFRKLTLFAGPTTIIDTSNLETWWESDNYQARDVGYTRNAFYGHLMFFGGSASPN